MNPLKLDIHNILNQHWEGTLANMQQTRKIKIRNVEPSLVVVGKY
jgi:hypothetical protein